MKTILILSVLLVGILTGRAADDAATTAGRLAYFTARINAEKVLKSPATAQWSALGTSATGWQKNANGTFAAWGTVDSQNTYGGVVRSSWCAVMKSTPDGYTVKFLRVGKVEFGDYRLFNAN